MADKYSYGATALRRYGATALRRYGGTNTEWRSGQHRVESLGMAPYEKLHAWQAPHRLALEIYRITENWPKSERFELTSQIRRAALSVPANIAEGTARWGSRELRRYLNFALGSLLELSYYLLFARDRGLLDHPAWAEIEELRNRAGQLTWRLLQSVARAAQTNDSAHSHTRSTKAP